nr:TraM recognition domain-containing protein [Streptomyces meridianus]
MGLLLLLLGLSVLVWTAAGVAAVLAHGSWPPGLRFSSTPPALHSLVTQPHDLPAAWPRIPASRLPGPGLFWGVLIGELMVLFVSAVFVVGTAARWRAGRAHREAGRDTVSEGKPAARTAETPLPAHVPAPAPEPSAPATPATGLPPSASGLLSGSGREGRPGLRITGDRPELRRDWAIEAIVAAEGPLLVVTSDPVLWSATRYARSKLGPSHVYDPGHLLDTPTRVRWSPCTGCASRRTAEVRAAALLAPVRSPHSADPAVEDAAQTLLGCWLHAAAVDGLPFRQVHRWASGAAAHEPVRLLRTHPRAAGGAAGELESALTAHPERRSAAQQLVSLALGALSAVHIRDACAPTRADSLAVESFAAEGGTLYVVGEAIEDPRIRPGAMPMLTALVSNVVELGRRVAERSSAGRLDPPLTLVLDDVAAVAPFPQFPDFLSAGASLGMPMTALLRSEEQLDARWPRRMPRR